MAKLPIAVSRQVRRRVGFDLLFSRLSRQYGGESRRVRRAMAWALMRKEWQTRERERERNGEGSQPSARGEEEGQIPQV
jgi:hypothetical protein